MTGDLSLIKKLKSLSNSLGGDVKLISVNDFYSLLKDNTLHKAPFTKNHLGIDYFDKIVYHTGDTKWYHIVHEMAHLFASEDLPYKANEFNFLGWEYATVKYIKAPLYQWHKDMYEYTIDKNGSKFGSLSKYKKRKLLLDRLQVAKNLNLISLKGTPLSIR